ncbi:MAG: PD-(D/E)XK nuclease family protein [Rubrimonas sp.]|uniref:PD-(D/E)XK nuclease family protein n=1 Tax=Rubrimonas sp. TaxID=2036015 RepID=UPI002FDE8BC0
MTLPFECPGPRLFYVAPGADFADALARGLRARLAGLPPLALAEVSLTLNTRRAARAVAAAFEAQGLAEGAGACVLPRLRALDEIGDGADAVDLPPPVARPRRLLALTRLVRAWLDARPDFAPRIAAPALAEALAKLIDETDREGVGLDALAGAAPPEHAAHWDATLAFLEIVRAHWPAILAQQEDGALDPEARRRRAVLALVARWAEAPPAAPMIAAGSTGSVGTTALLLQAIARAPQGAVVLPGYDPDIAADSWDGIDEQHPYAGIRRLIEALGLGPSDPAPWVAPDPATAPRRRLLGQALRPAPATDGWLDARPALAAEAEAATQGLTLIEAADPRREALALALAIRRALEAPGRRVALITPDRALSRRVTAALARWGLRPDDSGGRPLALTPPAMFLKLLADCACAPFDAVSLLALLKHPLAAAGEGRRAHLRAARRFELKALRARPGLDSAAACRAAAREVGAEALDPVFDALERLGADAPEALADRAALHLALAEALAGPELWAREAGEATRAAAQGFAEAAELFGPCPAADYPALFAACLTGEAREEAYLPDPRIAIWGPLEARTQSADLILLGGLNEGAWPASPAPDPWLSRPMRARLGLPPPERSVGLAAHDFLQGACAPDVILSRALREGGAPATPSRFLQRLTTLLGGAAPDALDGMRARGAALLAPIDALERPDGPPAPEPRPRPHPPVAARPRQLSATQVETLIRDPYAIYARKVLGLKPLDPVGRRLDARDRGVALHAAFARFGEVRMAGAPPEAALTQAVAEALRDEAAPPALRRLWRARIARLAPLFLREEGARAAEGRILAVERTGLREDAARRFALTARADRIDLLGDGRLALYDYKTGAIPTDAQIAQFAKQMPLEAAIAEAGGFEGLDPAPVARLAHLSIGGGKGAGGETRVKDDPAALAAEAWTGLMRLIDAYDDPKTAYQPRARPLMLKHAGDYDHLSRLGEWRDGEDR